jgi:membrane-associated phospholipid phosphatase
VPTASWVIAVALSLQHQQAPGSALTATAAWPDERPLTRILPNLRSDLAAFPRRDEIVILGAGIAGAALAGSADTRIADWARDAGAQRSYTPIGSLLGNEWLQGGAAIASYTIGKVQNSPELTHIGGDLIRAQVLNGVFTSAVKLAASRTRPNGGVLSFPSGHSSATFASATVLADHYGWKVGVPAYTVAAFTGWTRIRDHQHWLSDVVFGSALGIAAGKAVTFGHRHSTWSVVPVAAPGGGGVYVVKIR